MHATQARQIDTSVPFRERGFKFVYLKMRSWIKQKTKNDVKKLTVVV